MHCYKGVSRSATVVAAYLIKKYSYSLSQAVNLLREKRKKVHVLLTTGQPESRFHPSAS